MATPSTDISKYDLTDTQSAVSPAYVGGLFGALMAARGDGKLPHIYEYETPGTYSVTVPKGVNAMLVLGASGAGSSGALSTLDKSQIEAISGMSGASVINKLIQVSPGETLSIAIGRGGSGVASSASIVYSNAGGATSIANKLNLPGGPRVASSTAAYTKATPASPNGGAAQIGKDGQSGPDSLVGVGGQAPDFNGSYGKAGTRGGGRGSGCMHGSSYASYPSTAGGDGYLCFMFVNYDFDMSRGGGYSVDSCYYCSRGLAVLSFEKIYEIREAA